MPAWVGWLTAFGVVVSISWHIWDTRNRIQQEKKARRHSVYDHYWMREILFPICVKPLLDHADTTCKQITQLPVNQDAIDGTSQEWKEFWRNFHVRSQQIIDSSAVLSLMPTELRDSFIENLESMEDDIAMKLIERIQGEDNSLGEIVWTRTTAIIAKLASCHVTLN